LSRYATVIRRVSQQFFREKCFFCPNLTKHEETSRNEFIVYCQHETVAAIIKEREQLQRQNLPKEIFQKEMEEVNRKICQAYLCPNHQKGES